MAAQVERKVQPRPLIVAAFLPTGEPEKATEEVDFEGALAPTVAEGKAEAVAPLLAELTSARRGVLWTLDKDRGLVTTEEIVEKLRIYLSLLRGFRAPPGAAATHDIAEQAVKAEVAAPAPAPAAEEKKDEEKKGEEKKDGEAPADGEEKEDAAAAGKPVSEAAVNAAVAGSKRHLLAFVWRDIMDTDGDDFAVGDTMLEEACVLLAAAQRMLTRAGQQALNAETINGMYSMLRTAAGLLSAARKVAGESRAPLESLPADLSSTLPEAWYELALAQAQHCTLFRACSQPHIGLDLIGKLCADTSRRYSQPIKRHAERLTSSETKSTAQWAGKMVVQRMLTAHCEFKTLYFRALARYCQAAKRLEDPNIEDDGCVVALKSLNQGLAEFEEGERKAKAFQDIAKSIVYVDRTLPTSLDSCKAILRKQQEYADQLNNTVFYKPQPPEAEELPTPVTMVGAIPFEMPEPHPLWTQERYDALDTSKRPSLRLGKVSSNRTCCTIS
mmetsp:Transcript_10956/g.33349  ORF Transcript_10956/g.33349 Transcript_10956/m.33349 type:complete len:500 (-) Transcript_10956:1307-2806(-)